MSMPCNLDPYGKKLRLVGGALIEGLGLLMFVMWVMQMGPSWLIWPGAVLWISGTILMVASLMGCCPLRALGVKLPF